MKKKKKPMTEVDAALDYIQKIAVEERGDILTGIMADNLKNCVGLIRKALKGINR